MFNNFSNLSMEQCITKIPSCPRDRVNLSVLYKEQLKNTNSLPIQMFGGGKSGAFVFLLPNNRVLKYYTDAYDGGSDSKIDNQRPFREFLTMCRMSGTDGFPQVYNVFCAESPNGWIAGINKRDGKSVKLPTTKFGLAVVSSVAPGKELLSLADQKNTILLSKITPQVSLMIGLSMLMLVERAKEKMGQNFEHFDLHPENVFVDMNDIKTYSWRQYEWDGPKVSLIDFDLVAGDYKGFFQMKGIDGDPPEHKIKRDGQGILAIAERTLSLMTKLLGPQYITELTVGLGNIKNTDIRNWYITISAFFMFAVKRNNKKPRPLFFCRDLEECVKVNDSTFKNYGLGKKLLRKIRKRGLETAEEIVGREKQKIEGKGFRWLSELLKNRLINEKFQKYNQQAREKMGGIYPSYDDTIVRFTLPAQNAIDILFNAVNDNFTGSMNFGLMLGSTQIDIEAKAAAPKIVVKFNPHDVVDPYLWSNLPKFLLWFFQSLQYVRNPKYFVKKFMEKVKETRIKVGTNIVALNKLESEKKDLLLKRIMITPKGNSGIDVSTVVGAPSYKMQFLTWLGYMFSGQYDYQYLNNNTELNIKTTIPPPNEGDPTIWDQIVSAYRQAKMDKGKSLRVFFLFISTMFVIPELQEAISKIFCSIGPGFLQFVHISNGKEDVWSDPLSTNNIFPKTNVQITIGDVYKSYINDDIISFIGVAINYMRQICRMNETERYNYFRHMNRGFSQLGDDLYNVPGLVRRGKEVVKDPNEAMKLGKSAMDYARQDVTNFIAGEDPFGVAVGETYGAYTEGLKPRVVKKGKGKVKRKVKRKFNERYVNG